MKQRTASRIAWSVGTLSIGLMIGALVLMFVDRHVTLPAGGNASSAHWTFSNVLNVAVNIAVPALGILLVSRRPRNTIGWLFLAAGFMIGLSEFGTSYAVHALVADPGSLPAGRLFAWESGWLGIAPTGALAFLFLLFPTGHLRSARWRPVAWFVGSAFTLVTAMFLIFSTMSWQDPYRQFSSNGLFAILFILPLLSAIAASLAAVIVRFRRSTGEERLQLKWFAAGAVAIVATLIPAFATPVTPPVLLVLQSLAFVFLYAAIAIAILKYRLYEIDVVINKTVVYGLLAAFFTAVYVAVVVGIGTAIGSAQNSLLTLVAAAIIAIAFNPVRERAKRLADRLVYGKRATPYEVLSEFSSAWRAPTPWTTSCLGWLGSSPRVRGGTRRSGCEWAGCCAPSRSGRMGASPVRRQ